MDFVYTIHGALKSINHPSIGETASNGISFDPGKDGVAGMNGGFATDVFGFSIDYYHGDYERANTFISSGASGDGSLYVGPIGDPSDHFDGRIKSVRWNTDTDELMASAGSQNMYAFDYDWQQRLIQASFGEYTAHNQTNGSSQLQISPNMMGDFQESDKYKVHGLSYDLNGNIKTLKRNDKDGNVMDGLSYVYENVLNGFANNTNKLNHVNDVAGFADYEDMKDQTTDNYSYSTIGQMLIDDEKNIEIAYHTWGKVREIKDASTGNLKISYKYNESGQKIAKTDHNLNTTTYYVRDGAGSVLAIYEQYLLPVPGPAIQTEIPLPGTGVFYRSSNQYVYRIADHLGNVRALVSAEKDANGEAQVLAANDFYPFGMNMAGRSFASSPQYRYGYQGQEKENGVGDAGFYAFDLRLYDQRLGKWLSQDPYRQHWSPYLAMSNNPVSNVDPDGGWDFLFGRDETKYNYADPLDNSYQRWVNNWNNRHAIWTLDSANEFAQWTGVVEREPMGPSIANQLFQEWSGQESEGLASPGLKAYISDQITIYSTHTDKNGNVLAVYDDGDNGIYVHNDIDSPDLWYGNLLNVNMEQQDVSKMGETLEWDSFYSHERQRSFGKINFGSFAAAFEFLSFRDRIAAYHENHDEAQTIWHYMSNAGTSTERNIQIFDYKSLGGEHLKGDDLYHYRYRGSQLLPGVYLSARDVGNVEAGFVAGIFGIGKLESLKVMGMFNANSNQINFALLKELTRNLRPPYGEATNSHAMQRMGYDLGKDRDSRRIFFKKAKNY